MYDDLTSSSSSSCSSSSSSSSGTDVAEALDACGGTGPRRRQDLASVCAEIKAAAAAASASDEEVFLRLLPVQVSSGINDANFTRIAGIDAKSYYHWKKAVFEFKYQEIKHAPVWFTCADGRRIAIRPRTWVLRRPKATFERQMRRMAGEDLLEELPQGFGDIHPMPLLWYWDAAARTIVGYRITMLIVWSPLVLKHPGALHGLLPLVIHAGPMPAGVLPRPARPAVPAQPAREAQKAIPARRATSTSPARDRIPAVRARKARPARPAVPAREGVPDVRGTVHSLAASALHDLEVSMCLPAVCLPPRLRPLLPDGDVLTELINVSDMKSVQETSPDVHSGVVAFPHNVRNPNDDDFQNRLGGATSPGCRCTHVQQLTAGVSCVTEPRDVLRFFVSPVGAWRPVTCRCFYLRHCQIHGVPSAACDVCQLVEKRGRQMRDAGLLALSRRMQALFRSPFAPIAHWNPATRLADPAEALHRPVPAAASADAEHAAADAEWRAVAAMDEAVEAKRREGEERQQQQRQQQKGAAFRPDKTARLACVSAALEPHRRRLRSMFGRPTLDAVTRDLRAAGEKLNFTVYDASGTPLRERQAGDFFGEVVQLARTVHHPHAYLGDHTSQADWDAVASGSLRLMVDHKAIGEAVWPWRANRRSKWYMRLRSHKQREYMKAINGVRFVANATCFSPGSHEFYRSGPRPLVTFGPAIAAKMHEEAAEHLLLYWWLIVWVLGMRITDPDLKLEEAVMNLSLCHEALFVPVRAGLRGEAMNKYYKVSQKQNNEAWAGERQAATP